MLRRSARLICGSGQLQATLILWAWLAAAFIGVISLAVKSGLLATYPAGAISVAQLLPVVLVIFALPSSCALSGVTASETRQMRAAFDHFHVRRGAHLDSLLKATASVAERCKSRILMLKVGLGGLWAFFIYLFSKLESTQLFDAAQQKIPSLIAKLCLTRREAP